MGTDLHGADMRNSICIDVDMFTAKSLTSTFWYGARLESTIIRHDLLGVRLADELAANGQFARRDRGRPTFQQAREAYLGLKSCFVEAGRYEDASWAYVQERRMQRIAFFPTTVGHVIVGRETGQFARRLHGYPRLLRRLASTLICGT